MKAAKTTDPLHLAMYCHFSVGQKSLISLFVNDAVLDAQSDSAFSGGTIP